MYFQAVDQGVLFGFLKDIIKTRARFYLPVLQDGEFISSRGFSEKTHPTSIKTSSDLSNLMKQHHTSDQKASGLKKNKTFKA